MGVVDAMLLSAAMNDRAGDPTIDPVAPPPTGPTSRREVLRGFGALGVGALGASALLAGCGDASASARDIGSPYRILAFCGGGIRGLLSAGILERLAKKSPRIVSETDLLAGTSVGASIISLLLANVSPAQVYHYYSTSVPGFFKNPNTDPQMPAFDIDTLAAAQHQLHPTNPSLDAVKKKVVFTSFNVGSENRNWQPVLFNNLSKSTTGTTPLIDAVISSGAMPGELGSYTGHIDGAFVNHDPTLAAIALAINEGVRLENIVAICIGTGFMANWIASDTSQWGAEQWERGDNNPNNRTPPVLINGTESPVLSAAISGTSTNLVPDLLAMMLPGRYAYINPTLDRIVAEDDTNPADLDYLQAQAMQVDISSAVSLLNKYWR
jgi:hypothetical protein